VYKSASPSGLALNFGTFGTDGVGTITAGGADNTPGELVFNSRAGAIMLRPNIANNGTGAVRVVIHGVGVQVTGSNSYTGGSYVASGNFRASNIAGTGYGVGSVQVADSAQAYLDAIAPDNTFPGATYANDFYLAGTGTEGSAGINQGALRLGRVGIVVAGSVHLLSDSRITFHGAGTSPGAEISGKITGDHALKFGGGNASNLLNLSNPTNDWSGDTSIDFGTIRIAGAGEVIPNGPGKGNLLFSTGVGTLDLNGKTETVNGLNGRNEDLDQHTIKSSQPGGKLIFGDNNSSGSFGGALSKITDGGGQLAITKIGTGQQVIDGANNYTGTTTVEGGRLVLISDEFGSAWTPVLNNGGADLKGGRLVLRYEDGNASPAGQVQSILDAGFDQPTKFSTGKLRTSNPADPAKGLGWRDDVANMEVIVGYTYYGDANLDGAVNTLDFTALAANFNSISGIWEQGDFNYDGKVNGLDFNAIASNFGKTPPALSPAVGTLVPEPGSAVLLGLLSGCQVIRQRRAHAVVKSAPQARSRNQVASTRQASIMSGSV
jgi:autotransporter-associated beta strand protein